MKGYWINHVVEIKNHERFFAYAEASKSMFAGDNKYGALMKVFGSVTATLKGAPVSHAALVEFDSIQAAIDFGMIQNMRLRAPTWALWMTSPPQSRDVFAA